MHPSKKKRAEAWDDLFPPDGPVHEYKPFILQQARQYSQLYCLRYWEVVPEALRIALATEKKFDPKRGLLFSTLLYWELKRLNRWCQRKYRSDRELNSPGGTPSEPEPWEVENNRRAAKQEYERSRDVSWRRKQPTLPRRAPLEVLNYSRWKKAHAHELPALAEEAESLCPHLKTEKQRAVCSWLVGDLLDRETRTMTQAAADIGIGKSYMTKAVGKITSYITIWVTWKSFPKRGGIYRLVGKE